MLWSLKDVVNASLLTIFSELLVKNKSIIVADVEVTLVGLLISCLKPYMFIIDLKSLSAFGIL